MSLSSVYAAENCHMNDAFTPLTEGHCDCKVSLSCVLQYKGEYTLERYRRRFCNRPKMLECEQNFSRFSGGKTISDPFEKCSNFVRILKAIASPITAEVPTLGCSLL